jgi:hypothetical protein
LHEKERRKGGDVRRKISITVETERVLIVRRRRGPIRAWCDVCIAQADFAPLREVCALMTYDADTVQRLLAAGKLHAINAPNAPPLICLRSALGSP